MDENFATCRAHGCGIEVEVAKEGLPGRWCTFCGGGPEEVKCEFRLGQQQIPAVAGERRWETVQNGEDVVLEGANGTFCCITAMDTRWHKLECAVIVCDGLAEGGTGFVIHGVQVGGLVGKLKARVDGVIGSNAVHISFGGKGLYQNGIAGAVQGDHEVLVATAEARVEAPGVICEQLGKRYVKQGESG